MRKLCESKSDKINEREREPEMGREDDREREREREDDGRPPFQEVAVSCSYIVLKLFQSYR